MKIPNNLTTRNALWFTKFQGLVTISTFLVLLALPFASKAQQPVDVIGNPSVVNVSVGENFTIIMQLDATDANVTVADLFMTFNPNVINVISTEFAPGSPLAIPSFTTLPDNVAGKWAKGGFGFTAATTLFDFIVVECTAVGSGTTFMEHDTVSIFGTLLAFSGEDVTGSLNPIEINVVTPTPDCPVLGVNNGDPCFVSGEPAQPSQYVNCECASATPGNVEGNVNGLINCGVRDMTIEVYNQSDSQLEAVFNTTADANGDYVSPTFATGNYEILITVEGYLSQLYSNVTVNNGANQLDITGIIAGDINATNNVNIQDISILNLAFGTVSGNPNYNFLADFNCDGFVNILDLSILNISFGMAGDSAP